MTSREMTVKIKVCFSLHVDLFLFRNNAFLLDLSFTTEPTKSCNGDQNVPIKAVKFVGLWVGKCVHRAKTNSVSLPMLYS